MTRTRRAPVMALLTLALVAVAGLAGCQPAPAATAVTPGETAVSAARSQIGQPYVSGGESRAEGGFDCSGLTSHAWKQAGVTLPRRSVDQYSWTQRITKAQLLPGDLIFYSSAGPKGTVSHVGLYAGDGKIIQAHRPGVALSEDDLATYWVKNLVGYGRVPASEMPAS